MSTSVIFLYICKKIQTIDIIMLPEGFIGNMNSILGESATDLFEALEKKPEVSIKLNSRKLADADSTGYQGLSSVPWCDNGYYLPERPVFTLNPLMHAGAFYVQDASSMIYETIARKILPMATDTGFPLRVLDLCAAPGGKTTSLINALPDGTLVVANEIMPKRAAVLRENLIKWGYPDFIVTNAPTAAFTRFAESFDIVAVDAPCSGEGMMRKEEEAALQWSPGLIESCASLQREILHNAFKVLKPGGFLIYSTCTFNRQENEDNVAMLVEKLGMQPLDLGLAGEFGIGEAIGSPYPALRFMPHITRGEGLFVAVLRKEGDFPPASRKKITADALSKYIKIIADGIPETITKGRDIIPAPEYVFSVNADLSSFESFEADEETAIRFLRHEALQLPSGFGKGIVTVRYRGIPLGFVKNLGNRANNLYPQEWRIRNL